MAQIVWALVHEDEGPKGRVYGISFPDFPGVASGGRTVDEAIARGRETLAFHVEGMIEDGDAIPNLRSLEELRLDQEVAADLRDVKRVCLVEVQIEFPGKPVRVNISIEDRILDAIDRAAQAQGQSRSAFLAEAAREKIAGLSQSAGAPLPSKFEVREAEALFRGQTSSETALIHNLAGQLRAIRLCIDNRLFEPALVLMYSGMDFVASLSRMPNKDDVDRADFINWVEKYMKCQARLGVSGKDLYAARCGMVHTYTPDSKLHRKGEARRIFYTWGSQDPIEANSLLGKLGYPETFLKVETIFDAFLDGVGEFGAAIKNDKKLEKLVSSRGGKLFSRLKTFP